MQEIYWNRYENLLDSEERTKIAFDDLGFGGFRTQFSLQDIDIILLGHASLQRIEEGVAYEKYIE